MYLSCFLSKFYWYLHCHSSFKKLTAPDYSGETNTFRTVNKKEYSKNRLNIIKWAGQGNKIITGNTGKIIMKVNSGKAINLVEIGHIY